MDPITRPMFMGAAGEESLIGTFLEGGYFAGYISQTADGNATHGLIVAPAASGYNGGSTLQWQTTNTSASGTSSEYDGAANTINMRSGALTGITIVSGNSGLRNGTVSYAIVPASGGDIAIVRFNISGNVIVSYVVQQPGSGFVDGETYSITNFQAAPSGTTTVVVAVQASAVHPVADYCVGLTINGYSDWYLPALYELEIAYYNLKPTTESNTTSHSINSYAVPQRGSNYTAGNPTQTSVADFQSGGAEAFLAVGHWSSTELSSTTAQLLQFSDGIQGGTQKTNNRYVRAFRKFAV